MADLKISQLTSATLPLAGTEVLPIVQSSSTRKVATDDLTVKNLRSNATTGILQVAGPAAGTTRIMTTPNANFTAARTDAAQSFTGDQTLATGNLIQGTAGKGINFTANASITGQTTRLLADYAEATWTPTWNGGTVTMNQGTIVKVGKLVLIQADIDFGTSASTSASTLSIPINFSGSWAQGSISYTDVSNTLVVNGDSNNISFRSAPNGANVDCATLSGKRVIFSVMYISA